MRRIFSQIIPKITLCLCGTMLLAACSAQVANQADRFTPHGTFSTSGKVPLTNRWWTAFNDASLNTLVEQALAENLTLQMAWDRLDQARAVARKAGAALSPQLDASASGSRTRTESNGQHVISTTYDLGLSASYEIDLWGSIHSSQEAARLDAQSQGEDLQTAALTLSAQVANTWFQLIEQNQQIALLQQQLEVNQKNLELVSLQFRTGQIDIADLLQQRQVVENRQGLITLANTQKSVLENQLSLLLGTAPGDANLPTADTLAELPPLPQTGMRSDLLQRRPDIRSAWLQLQAADQRLAAAAADRFPSLSLTARGTTSATEISDLFDDWLANLTANLVAPLLDGGRRQAEVARVKASATETLHNFGQTILDALAEVEDTLVYEEQQQLYLASLDQQLALATQATARIRDRYVNGAEDYQRVLTSVLAEQQLQRTRLTAQLDLLANRIKMYRALAGGWDLKRPPSLEAM